eukprot:13286739-Alexandrium_andersonii.AAC.1
MSGSRSTPRSAQPGEEVEVPDRCAQAWPLVRGQGCPTVGVVLLEARGAVLPDEDELDPHEEERAAASVAAAEPVHGAASPHAEADRH